MVQINNIIKSVKPKDLAFLLNLDKRLRRTEKCGGGFYAAGYRYNYTERKMKLKELEEVLRITKKSDCLVLYPINANHGFSVGFEISAITKAENCLFFHEYQKLLKSIGKILPDSYKLKTSIPSVENEPLLGFIEQQVPKNNLFEYLSKYFMKKENLKHAKSIGLEIINNRATYDY